MPIGAPAAFGSAFCRAFSWSEDRAGAPTRGSARLSASWRSARLCSSIVLLEGGGEYPNGARTLEIAAIARAKQRTHLPIVVDVPTIAQRSSLRGIGRLRSDRGRRRRRDLYETWIGRAGEVPRVPATLSWSDGVVALQPRSCVVYRSGDSRMKPYRHRRFIFGLIGGSLSLALRRNGGVHVTAIDRAPVLARAETKNAADELLPLEEADKLKNGTRTG